jgi:Flp pilus assembly protein TadG
VVIRAVRPDREVGNAALELVILAPALLFLLGLIIAMGRVSTAQNAVSDAAQDAARQASLQLNPAGAIAAGQASAQAALAADGLDCDPHVTVHTDGGNGLPGFQAQVGQPAAVSATVTCVVSLAQIVVPGLPGSRAITETFTSPLDPYRER